MRILLCDRLIPSGAAVGGLIDAISDRLAQAGHQVEQILLPYHDDFLAAPSQLMAIRLMAVKPFCDVVITFGAPLHVVDQQNKVIWCCNEPGSLLPSLNGSVPSWLAAADRLAFQEARRVFVSSDARRKQLMDRAIKSDLLPIPNDISSSRELDTILFGSMGFERSAGS